MPNPAQFQNHPLDMLSLTRIRLRGIVIHFAEVVLGAWVLGRMRVCIPAPDLDAMTLARLACRIRRTVSEVDPSKICAQMAWLDDRVSEGVVPQVEGGKQGLRDSKDWHSFRLYARGCFLQE